MNTGIVARKPGSTPDAVGISGKPHGLSQYNRGFTLFEILIAVSIFAVIGAITMTSLIQVGRSGEVVSKKQQKLSDIQFALAYFAKDWSQLVGRKLRDQYGDEQPALLLHENVLTFTRKGWSNLLQQKRSNEQRVEYRLRDDVLQRRYWPELDQAYSEVVVAQTLLRDVDRFELRLLTKGRQKIDAWPPDAQNASPQKPIALEVTLDVKGFGEIRRIFELAHAI